MKYKEDNLQKSVAKYLDLNKFLWCHVANERKTSMQAGKRLKLKGVKSGVPDVLIFDNNSIYKGLAIELKIKPNYTTENQDKWLEDLSVKGWKTVVCYSFDEVLKVVEEYKTYI